MTGFEVYSEYLALKRHFSPGTYNYNKYNGKIKLNEKSFLRRKDRGLFNQLAFKYKSSEKIKNFFIANFVYKFDFTIYDVKKYDTKNVFEEWEFRINNIDSFYFKDLRKIFRSDSVKELFISKDGALPKIINFHLKEEICIESLVILDVCLKFLKRNEEAFKDDLFEEYSNVIKNYKTFLPFDYNKLSNLTMDTINKSKKI